MLTPQAYVALGNLVNQTWRQRNPEGKTEQETGDFGAGGELGSSPPRERGRGGREAAGEGDGADRTR